MFSVVEQPASCIYLIVFPSTVDLSAPLASILPQSFSSAPGTACTGPVTTQLMMCREGLDSSPLQAQEHRLRCSAYRLNTQYKNSYKFIVAITVRKNPWWEGFCWIGLRTYSDGAQSKAKHTITIIKFNQMLNDWKTWTWILLNTLQTG